MSRLKSTAAVCTALALGFALVPTPGLAGGVVQVLDVTGNTPSPIEGQVVAKVIPRKWDTSCIPLRFKVNDTLDPVPNPLGADFVTVADVVETLQSAADQWNQIPTSFMEIQVDGTTSNPGGATFDQINEITFRYNPAVPPAPRVSFSLDFGAIAYVRTTVTLNQFTFPDGLDLDGDGDPDVSDTITQCQDLDGDGDAEVPAKTYPAGTTLDLDLVFSAGENLPDDGTTEGFRFTTRHSDIDDDPRSVDLYAMGIQLFGTAHFVAHSVTNQYSDYDGLGSPMFPSIDTGDSLSEWSHRYLDADAVATSSYLYPEGTEDTGPAAIQAGDIPFDLAFAKIEGEIHHGELDQPLVGANVWAEDFFTGRKVGTAISGTAQWSTQPNGFGAMVIDADYHVIDGRYTLVVPPGLYRVGVEAVDDFPVGHANVNLHTILHWELEQDDFHEDYYSGPHDGAIERRPDFALPVLALPGKTRSGVDITTNATIDIEEFGLFDTLGFTDAEPGTYLAVRVPAEAFREADAAAGGDLVLHAIEYLTGVQDSSDVPRFAQALLAKGRVKGDGTAKIDLGRPLARDRNFTGQDFDFAPFYFRNPVGLANKIRRHIERGKITDLFLVLQLPHHGPLPVIGLDGGPDNDVPITGSSFVSIDGSAFVPSTDYNFMFRLVASDR